MTNASHANPTAALEADETAQKRAQADQFSFDVNAPGLIEVTNESHENPADHQYVVTLDDVTDNVMACTCPHHVHRSAFCKHMAAVETATDDGTLTAFPSDDDKTDEDDAEPEECDCDGLNGFPCWPCVRAHRKELPN
ncbi:SWIM zinc finger family protein [Haladaptatus pallidirubidus]|uniref:SWIM zinc finger family protein n=1 Tax=Haladaptatus pallidirubidus TaxID=1008152 RepID=UPI001D0F56FD|nr:SWIM zinc finger family protein [Haladaptatus pallidirubidus]